MGFAYIVPFYNEALIGICIWSAFFGGAELIYAALRPYLLRSQDDVDKLLAEAQQKALEAAEVAKVAAAKKVEELKAELNKN